jgi:hypothetical protein
LSAVFKISPTFYSDSVIFYSNSIILRFSKSFCVILSLDFVACYSDSVIFAIIF